MNNVDFLIKHDVYSQAIEPDLTNKVRNEERNE